MEKKSLFAPYKVGDVTIKNRICMAALTRCRCDPKDGVPTDLHVEYYSQRAQSAGLILTECSQISPDSLAFPGSAGIHSEEQVAGWKRVTDAVHKAGSVIYLQIWHGGRSVPEEFAGQQGIAPSPIAIKGTYYSPLHKKQMPHTTPRELTRDEIKTVISNFRKGAENAKKAGFDGLELHGAHGYLVDEFLRTSSNQRTDEYGGSVENRCRFALEVMDELIAVFGAGRVGIKVSPVNRYNDQFDEKPLETYTYLLNKLNEKGVAFVEIREATDDTVNDYPLPKSQIPEVCKAFRPIFKGTIMANDNMTLERSNKFLEEGIADIFSYGRLIIANPDLTARFQNGWPLNSMDFKTAYTSGPAGYIDYKTYEQEHPEEAKKIVTGKV